MTQSFIKIVFFGSTAESVIVLERIIQRQISNVQLHIVAVATQPPRPVGRHQELVPTLVEMWAKEHEIPVLTFPSDPATPWLYANERKVIDAIQTFKPDLLVSASYGQKIPAQTINEARYGGLNVHPSLLPRWRGADPVPWAILSGDHQTGVTIVTLAEHFDEGKIIAQKKIPILPTDTTSMLYPKLFTLGAELLIDILPDYINGKNKGHPQVSSQPTPGVDTIDTYGYARRLTKQDGFISWDELSAAMEGNKADEINQKFRAFDPWPGLWSTVRIKGQEKRLKILQLHLQGDALILDKVQLEGKNPISYTQFSSAY